MRGPVDALVRLGASAWPLPISSSSSSSSASIGRNDRRVADERGPCLPPSGNRPSSDRLVFPGMDQPPAARNAPWSKHRGGASPPWRATSMDTTTSPLPSVNLTEFST